MLPRELWQEIMMASPGAYYVLVQCCKDMATGRPMDELMSHFTTYKYINNHRTYGWVLPNGLLHCKDGFTPSIANGVATYYFYCGKYHSYNNIPAVQCPRQGNQWLHYGVLHRENDLPAWVTPRGAKYYYYHGVLHREGNMPRHTILPGTKQRKCKLCSRNPKNKPLVEWI